MATGEGVPAIPWPVRSAGARDACVAGFGSGQGGRRCVNLWFFRPINHVAPRFSTGHGVLKRRVCDVQRDVGKPSEFADGRLKGPRDGLQGVALGAALDVPIWAVR